MACASSAGAAAASLPAASAPASAVTAESAATAAAAAWAQREQRRARQEGAQRDSEGSEGVAPPRRRAQRCRPLPAWTQCAVCAARRWPAVCERRGVSGAGRTQQLRVVARLREERGAQPRLQLLAQRLRQLLEAVAVRPARLRHGRAARQSEAETHRPSQPLRARGGRAARPARGCPRPPQPSAARRPRWAPCPLQARALHTDFRSARDF